MISRLLINTADRLGFAVLLCYLRGPGFPPDKNVSSQDGVVSRLATHLKLQPALWAEYVTRGLTWLATTTFTNESGLCSWLRSANDGSVCLRFPAGWLQDVL